MFGRPRRLAILVEGRFTAHDAKTAVGMLRYRPGEVVAVLDSTRAPSTTAEVVGVGGATPVVAAIADAAALGADTLMIGVAPQGGRLPDTWRASVLDALSRGWDVFSGLHETLDDDAEFARMARAHGATIHDVRRTPQRRPIAARRAAAIDALVVLTVGSDCNSGKMTAALELVAALRARQVTTAFVATGQTGIFCAGQGVALDAVPADFIAGFAEEAVLAAAPGAQVVVVEGQGALSHPGYSGVTLGLLHGACPAALILCHDATRSAIRGPAGDRGPQGVPIAPLPELVRAYEEAARWVHPARVIAVALDTHALDASAAREAVAAAGRTTGLPACDPVREGAAVLADAVTSFARARRDHAPHA